MYIDRDHSPLLVTLTSGRQASNMSWRLNPFWLESFPKEDIIPNRVLDFWSLNLGSASIQVVWDALKAYLRGLLIQNISIIKSASHRELEL